MLPRSFDRSSRRSRCCSSFVFALESARDWWLEAHQGPSQLCNVIFNKLTVIVDHVFGNPCRFELVVQRPPLWRRSIIVVEYAFSTPRPLSSINIHKFTSRSRLLTTAI